MNKKALSTMMAVFLVLAIGAVGYVIGTSSGVTGYAVKPANIDSSNLCRYGEKQCGFGAGKSKKLECQTFPLDDPNSIGKTGYEYCVIRGFDTCASLELRYQRKLYASTDNTCKNVQMSDMTHGQGSCSQQIEEFYQTGCMTTASVAGEEPYAEPYNGDIEQDSLFTSVICCK